VESMLSARFHLRAPAWALLSAGNLARFEPPAGVERLIIAHDNDAAGLEALEQLRARLSKRLDIVAAPPPTGFNDWNDWDRAARF
ncbi:MAG TPA: toprim domain-containing protein, partial [Verrucomicrobiae bacterium]|nr:toprim domain-containing protein [Verrucomicrobiae bacterium]